MKKTKKALISLAAGLLATAPVVTLATTTNQAHAVKTTEKIPSFEEGVLKLNHKARVYNKKGQKKYSYLKSNGLFEKGASIKYIDKIKAISNPDTKRYSFHDDDWNWFYLPYKTIKGKEYYSIGHGGYIKAVNVDSINGVRLYTNYATVRMSSSPIYFPKGKGNAVTVNNQGKFTNKFIKKGTKLIIDRSSDRERLANSSAIDEMDNRTLEVYRIKNSKQSFILQDDVKKLPRHKILPYTNSMVVKFLHDATTYTIDGIPNSVDVYKQGDAASVVGSHYIWIPSLNRSELFYQVLNILSVDRTYKFVKASDIRYLYGRHLEPSNITDNK